MGTSILTPSATFTQTTGTQPIYGPPLDVLQYSATAANYIATELTLPANGISVALPVPATWSTVTNIIIQNIDSNSANYAVLNQPGTGSGTGTTSTQINSFITDSSATLTVGMTFIFKNATTGVSYTFLGVTGTPTGLQFNPKSPAANIANFNALTGTTGMYMSSPSVESNPDNSFTFSTIYTSNCSLMSGTGFNNSICYAGNVTTLTVPGTFTVPAQALQLAPNGGQYQASFGTGTPTGVAPVSPKLWTLSSSDINGILANGQSTRVYVYIAGT